MKVKDIGEFGLIERVAALVGGMGPPGAAEEMAGCSLILGIGDDAAAWRINGLSHLFTTDTLVEGVHFLPGRVPWRDLGWKAMAVNYSDIAAMGGNPIYSLVTLGVTGEESLESVDELYRGMLDVCRAYGGRIVGGDLVRSATPFISVALLGVARGPLLRRSGARPGDLIAVTGPLGASAGGLRILKEGLALPQEAERPLVEAHLRPRPRLEEGQRLAALGVQAAMDISDGLLDDLQKMCQASGVAARLQEWQVPVHPVLARAFPREAMGMALSGGEDYELLFAAPEHVMDRVLVSLPSPAFVIGHVSEGTAGQVVLADRNGKEVLWTRGGWDHFR
ncbi:MAG: thiamine-phosphate kinase [Chloroflexi bacterium]|nr:thiamine-phosphate kinase [Chloroflexota bacterium]